MPRAQRPTSQITFPLAFRLELRSREADAWPTISNSFPECKAPRGRPTLPCIRVLFGPRTRFRCRVAGSVRRQFSAMGIYAAGEPLLADLGQFLQGLFR